MWIARNKNGELRIFEEPPRRYHEGPMLDSNLVGFNDTVSVGNDDYSFWAVQEFYQSNRIDDRKHCGIRIMTERIENGKKFWYSYVPECAKELTWEDEPIEIEIQLKKK
jgi:hypothetical protein